MMFNVLVVLEVILSIILITVILLQPSKSDGLKGFLTGNSETFFSRNKSRTKEALLARITVVTAILIAAVTVGLNLISR